MLKSYLKRILDLITRPEMKILPGQLAFFLVLSIFPLLTLYGYIGSKILFFAPLREQALLYKPILVVL